jgi:hypothetical protein
VTVRRIFTDELMPLWSELLTVVEQIVLCDASDSLIWCYNTYGVYSTPSFLL